jgi:protein TonB
MSRDLIIAIFVSLLLHGGTALSGYLFKKPVADKVVAKAEIPTVQLDMPPPPEPEKPEVVEEEMVTDAPKEVADIAPPMQNDTPSAVIDSPFKQQIQAPPPPGVTRPSGNAISIPTNTRPAVASGKAMGAIFDLASLDQKPEARVRIAPQYPFEMRRSGLKGEVVVQFIVDSSGEVRDPVIVKTSNSGFNDAAIQAVLKWKFKPGRKGGSAVNTRVQQLLGFNLNTER